MLEQPRLRDAKFSKIPSKGKEIMELKEFQRRINHIETSHDVASLEVSGIRVWPFIRLRMWELVSKNVDGTSKNLLRRLKRALVALLHYAIFTLWPFGSSRCEVVFFGRSTESSGPRASEKSETFEGLISWLHARLKTNVWQVNDQVLLAPSFFRGNLAFPSDIHFVFAAVSKWLPRSPQPDKLLLSKELKEELGSLFDPVGDLTKDINRILRLADLYEKALGRASARLVVLSVFYRPEAFAMCIAASRLGVKTVEIQHGAANDVHPMYASWLALPDNGYEMIPDKFWCWGEISAKRINAWASSTDKHEAHVAGDLRGKTLFEKRKSMDEAQTSQRILFSLQSDELLPNFLEDVIEEFSKDVTWTFRSHPRIKEFQGASELAKRFENVSLCQAENEDLYYQLRNSAIHVTAYSSVAFEAQRMGIPTIFTHEIAGQGHQYLTPENGLYLAVSKDTFSLVVRKLLANRATVKPVKPYIEEDPRLLKQCLEDAYK